MKKIRNYRQGEVLILTERADGEQIGFPQDWKKRARLIKDGVIAEGEISGHKHEVANGRLYDHPEKKGIMILEAGEGCTVTHPEHKPVSVPKGVYEIEIQREFTGGKEQSRKVKD